MTADDKYSVLNKDSLMQPIQMRLFQKQKFYSEFFSQRLNYGLNFEHFRKNDDPHSRAISEITDSK